MKRDLITPLGFLALLLILMGSLTFLPATASTIPANVIISPEKINLNDPPDTDAVVTAEVKFPKEFRDRQMDINGSTVLLDGVIPPLREDKSPGKYKAFFDKQAVQDYLWLKLAHMGHVDPFKNKKVELTITGNLYDGTPFEGSDIVFVSAK